jgi:hypothetical protein
MKVAEIPTMPILEFLEGLEHGGCRFDGSDGPFDNSVSKAFPSGTPPKVIWATMRSLIRKGLVKGCTQMHNCRGDYELTQDGTKFLKEHKVKA